MDRWSLVLRLAEPVGWPRGPKERVVTGDSGTDDTERLTNATDPTIVPTAADAVAPGAVPVTVSLRVVWRVGLVVMGLVALALFLRFVITDGGSVLFTVLMSWFAALVMTPLVNRLAKHMRRGAATGLVMVGFAAFVVVFFLAFGALFVQQLAQLIELLPTYLDQALEWVNDTFSMALTTESVLESVSLTPDKLAAAAGAIGVSLLGVLGSAVGTVFSMFTFAMFIFYLSAQLPQLERWVAGLFPARSQMLVARVWSLTLEKTGGYVGARVVLAGINSATTAVVFVIIGMPYWLPLSLWTGIVAQFVPTIGTYISIALPVIIGLLSPTPVVGVIALVWAILYQQVENLLIEPRISAKAVEVNPAVSFGAVLLGAALFGVAGAFLAVPVVAMLLALLNIYGHRYELLPEISERIDAIVVRPKPSRSRRRRTPAADGVTESPGV
jgi:predicted PurR-regulated permease PerM